MLKIVHEGSEAKSPARRCSMTSSRPRPADAGGGVIGRGEVAGYVDAHRDLVDDYGRRLVVRTANMSG